MSKNRNCNKYSKKYDRFVPKNFDFNQYKSTQLCLLLKLFFHMLRAKCKNLFGSDKLFTSCAFVIDFAVTYSLFFNKQEAYLLLTDDPSLVTIYKFR